MHVLRDFLVLGRQRLTKLNQTIRLAIRLAVKSLNFANRIEKVINYFFYHYHELKESWGALKIIHF